jgi:hypothetical protein
MSFSGYQKCANWGFDARGKFITTLYKPTHVTRAKAAPKAASPAKAAAPSPANASPAKVAKPKATKKSPKAKAGKKSPAKKVKLARSLILVAGLAALTIRQAGPNKK